MSYVFANPEWVTAAATDLASIGSSITEASSAAAAPTGGVIAAGADDISALIAALFSAHAEAYQSLSQQASLFHQQFVSLMNAGASQYATAETLNELPMQEAATAISAPLQAMGGVSPGGSMAAAAPVGHREERVLHAGKDGSYVQIGAGGHSGAVAAGGHSVGAPNGALPGSAVSHAPLTGSGASGAFLGNAAALTGTSAAAANGAVGTGIAGGPAVSSFGDGSPGMGGMLSGQTPTSATLAADRAIVSAPASRGGDEGHTESVSAGSAHSGAVEGGESGESPAHALEIPAGPSNGEGGLRGPGGPLYGHGNSFYATPAVSAEQVQQPTPGR